MTAFQSPPYDGLTARFGEAGGPDCTAGRVVLPFPFVIAWDVAQKINTFACHKLAAPVFSAIFAEAVAQYGEARFKALRLHYFGGCFNHRPMRGGTRLSVHSWGVAIDLDPARNQLTWGRDRAAFGAADYEPFWRIVEGQGAFSLGRVRNLDWMHFQLCRA